MIPVTKEEFTSIELRRGRKTPGKYEKELHDFLNSNAYAARLDTFGTKDVHSTATCYRSSATRNRIPVKVTVVNGTIYATVDENMPVPTDNGPWYEKLCSNVIGVEYEYPKDIEETVRHVIETFLSEKEQKIILSRYKDAETLNSIAVREGVTRERIRQIQVGAERVLRRDKCREFLIFGLQETNRREKERELAAEKAQEEREARLAAERQKLMDEYNVNISKKIAVLTQDIDFSTEEEGVPIDYADFSTRTYNVLRREGNIHTINALLKARQTKGRIGLLEWLATLRNCGLKTADEVVRYTDNFFNEEDNA